MVPSGPSICTNTPVMPTRLPARRSPRRDVSGGLFKSTKGALVHIDRPAVALVCRCRRGAVAVGRPHTEFVLGGAWLGSGAAGSSIRSSRSGVLLRTLLTARLTGQRRSTPAAAGRNRAAGSPGYSPSHTG